MKIIVEHDTCDRSEGDLIIQIQYSNKSSAPILEQEYLSAEEVSTVYGLSSVVVEHNAQEGKIPYLEVNEKRVYSRFAIEKWLSDK